MRIPDDFITLLREKIDIVDVISEYVRLKRSGRSFVGSCPFHSEKTPSFHVTPSKGYYYCFGCGVGGTVINFLMEMEQMTFYQAVTKLAERAGLPIPAIQDPENHEKEKRRADLFLVHELAAKYYNHILMNHEAGLQGLSYFLHRGLTKKTVAQFQLGFAPASERVLTDFLLRRGFAPDLIVSAGLTLAQGSGDLRDRFRNRVMFPIWDLQGRVLGFGARTLGGDEPKYVNTSDTELFHKGRVLYGLAKARQKIRQTGQVILLEGYMDVIAFHQHGMTNAVAGLGTALTPEQAGLLKRVAEEVILLYDGDLAGQKATLRSLEVLKEANVEAKIVELPVGKDPDEWIQDNDADAWKELLGKGKRALFYQLSQLTHQHPDHLGSGRIEYVRDAVDIVAKESSSVEREAALEWISKTYSIPLTALREDLEKQIKSLQKKLETDKGGKKWNTLSRTPVSVQKGVQLPLEGKRVLSEKKLLTYMLLDADVTRQVQTRLQQEFSVPIHSALQAYLYQFYTVHDKADPELFLNYLDDPALLSLTTGLLQKSDDGLDESDVSQGIEDYIQCLLSFEVEKAMQEVVEKMKIATERGDFEAMREYEGKRKALRAQLNESQKHVLRLNSF